MAVVEERGVEEGRGVVEHRDAEREGNGAFREEVLERVIEGAPARSKPLARPRSEAPSYSCPFTDCTRNFHSGLSLKSTTALITRTLSNTPFFPTSLLMWIPSVPKSFSSVLNATSPL